MTSQSMSAEIVARLLEREAELDRIQRIGKIGGLEVDLRDGGFVNTRSAGYLAVHGLPPEAEHESHEDWLRRIHPDDRERMQTHFVGAVRGTATDYAAEYRVVRPSDGQVRWILAKGQIERDETGAPLRFVGAHLDITDRKASEEQTELIARELSHRIKNLLAVIQGIVRMMGRAQPEHGGFVDDLLQRLHALDVTNELVRQRHSSTIDHQAGLTALVNVIVEPYRGVAGTSVAVSGDDAAIGRDAATALALILHELATNAAKYGALSARGGSLAVASAVGEGGLTLTWTEAGGPPVEGPPARTGFGTVMSGRIAAGLRATVERSWRREGLRVVIIVPEARLCG